MFNVSVVICVYSELRWDRLSEAVESLARQSLPPREIVVVVDYNEALLDRVSRAFPRILAVANREGKGLSGARNTGIRVASGEWIAFLDDDAVATEDWLERLSEHSSDPDIIGVGGAVLPKWSGARPNWFPEEYGWVVGCSYRGLPSVASPIRNLIGANMCLRRETFDIVGGFRSDLGRSAADKAGCEETELCIRALKRLPGRRFVYEPLAQVFHHVPESRARLSYFRGRCYAEGISKSRVAQIVGRADGLASESRYVLQVLPRGIAGGIADAVLRRDLFGFARAGIIVAGLIITATGFLVAGSSGVARLVGRQRVGRGLGG